MSAIVKEYSCTPMEPIRIRRRLVQSSSLSLSSPLPFLSRRIHVAGGEAGDGRVVKQHSVARDPSSPSLVDGSLYTSSRFFMSHNDMCSRERQYYFDYARSTQPCRSTERRESPLLGRPGTSSPGERTRESQ